MQSRCHRSTSARTDSMSHRLSKRVERVLVVVAQPCRREGGVEEVAKRLDAWHDWDCDDWGPLDMIVMVVRRLTWISQSVRGEWTTGERAVECQWARMVMVSAECGRCCGSRECAAGRGA